MAEPEQPDEVVGVGRPRPPGRELPEAALAVLRSELGARRTARSPVPPLDELVLPDPTLTEDGARAAGATRSASAWVKDDRLTRVIHAAGKGYPDLVRMRSGSTRARPTRSSIPATQARCARVLEACADEDVAVVPFGGGTSVVGGVEPVRDGRDARDRARPRPHRPRGRSRPALPDRDARSRGCAARRSSRRLPPRASRSATTRSRSSTRPSAAGSRRARRARPRPATARSTSSSAGCAASTPAGDFALRPIPATAAGPGLRRAPGRLRGRARRDHRGDPAGAPAAGGAARTRPGCSTTSRRAPRRSGRSSRRHVVPDVARLSDPHETRLSMMLSDDGSLQRRVGQRYIGARGYDGGCIAILGWEGDARDVNSPQVAERAHPAPRGRPGARLRPGQGLGCAGASRGHTCATRCSTAA